MFCAETVQKRIIHGKEMLLLSYLLKDGATAPYQALRLKKRIQSRYPQVVFHSSKTMNKGTLVYSDDRVPGDIADDMMEIDHADESQDEETDTDILGKSLCGTGKATASPDNEIFNAAMEIRRMTRESKGVDGWPPDSNDLTIDLATESIPIKLFNFVAWAVGYSDEPSVDERVMVSHGQSCKVVSICHDLVYAEAKSKKQTHKSLALGMAVRQTTGSTKLINSLHRLGHSVSSSTVCKHNSALASISYASEHVNIPRNANVGLFTTIVWDNNDFNDETLTGKGTTQVTNGIVIQKGKPARHRK